MKGNQRKGERTTTPPPPPTPHSLMSAPASFRGPLKVTYCSSCSLPPEYCEFGGQWDQCKVLLEKSNPDLLAQMVARMKVAPPPPTPATADGEPALAAEEKAPKKKAPKGDDDDEEDDEDDDDESEDEAPAAAAAAGGDDEFLAAAAPVKPKKAALAQGIYLSMANRSKKKFITTIRGFDTFGIVLKDVAKVLAKKFACAASVVKATDGSEIAIQGDLIQDLPHWIIEEYKQIDKKLIWTVDKAGKKVRAF